MRRLLAAGLGLLVLMGCDSQPARTQEAGSEPASATRAAASSSKKAEAVDWAAVSSGAMATAPYPIYGDADFAGFMGVVDSGEEAVATASIRTPDDAADVAAFYAERLAGWTRRDVPGGTTVFLPPDRAGADGFYAMVSGPSVVIEPRTGPHDETYTLVTFNARPSGS